MAVHSAAEANAACATGNCGGRCQGDCAGIALRTAGGHIASEGDSARASDAQAAKRNRGADCGAEGDVPLPCAIVRLCVPAVVPLTVLLKVTALLVVVRVVLAPRVTAPV